MEVSVVPARGACSIPVTHSMQPELPDVFSYSSHKATWNICTESNKFWRTMKFGCSMPSWTSTWLLLGRKLRSQGVSLVGELRCYQECSNLMVGRPLSTYWTVQCQMFTGDRGFWRIAIAVVTLCPPVNIPKKNKIPFVGIFTCRILEWLVVTPPEMA